LAGHDAVPIAGPSQVPDLSGIWHSRYVYFSDGRGQEFEGHHYVVLTQQGNRVVGQSLPHTSESELRLRLVVEGSAVSGIWSEKTSPTGYYQEPPTPAPFTCCSRRPARPCKASGLGSAGT
jgi:hypothetical protein